MLSPMLVMFVLMMCLLVIGALLFAALGFWVSLHPEDTEAHRQVREHMKSKLPLLATYFGICILAALISAPFAVGELKAQMKEAAVEWWEENGSAIIDKTVERVKEKAKDSWSEVKEKVKEAGTERLRNGLGAAMDRLRGSDSDSEGDSNSEGE